MVSDFFLKIRVSIKRNLSNYNFASTLPQKKAVEIYQKITHACSLLPEYLGESYQFDFYELHRINFLLKKNLEVKGVLPENFKTAEGMGVAICQHCFIRINFDDHITIATHCFHEDQIPEMLSILNKVEGALGEMLSFGFDKELGFLTSDINYLGTGLKIETFVYSFFDHYVKTKKDRFLKTLMTEFGSFMSMATIVNSEKESEISKYLFLLSTQHSSFENFDKFVAFYLEKSRKIRSIELEERNKFLKYNYDVMYDCVLKAFLIAKHAILVHEYQVYDLLACFYMGLQMGLLENLKPIRLYDFFTELRSPCIVETILNESNISLPDVTFKMIEKKRASILRATFENVTIKDYKE